MGKAATYPAWITTDCEMTTCVDTPLAVCKLALHDGLEPEYIGVERLGDEFVSVICGSDRCCVWVDVSA